MSGTNVGEGEPLQNVSVGESAAGTRPFVTAITRVRMDGPGSGIAAQ